VGGDGGIVGLLLERVVSVSFFWDVGLETDGCIHLEWHGSGKTNDIDWIKIYRRMGCMDPQRRLRTLKPHSISLRASDLDKDTNR
jgi:hypothetical protein